MIQNLDKLDSVLERMLRATRIPGAGIAIVANGETVFARGYGYRDIEAQLPTTSRTLYPIASTSKAINATLLGMLVDDGRIAWDAPVQEYLPKFRLNDPYASTHTTVRDLIIMRTGLPRHDWVWSENPVSRAELVERLRHLEFTFGFRERYQYNNLTVTTSGHVAEVVTGKTWEELVRERILEPLGMDDTVFELPTAGDFTRSYCEGNDRKLRLTHCLTAENTAPSGGSIHSTVEDMARWMSFNLRGGQVDGRQLIQPQTLAEIHTPQMVVPPMPNARKRNAAYAMGWTVDTYQGKTRVSHGGYLHDVNSEVMLLPEERIGIVSFINFGPPSVAFLLCQYAYETIKGLEPTQTFEQSLAQYEKQIEETRRRITSVPRVAGTSPSHSLADYAGVYEHPGYGRVEIHHQNDELTFQRHRLVLPLQHWHYDSWVFKDEDLFWIHQPHPFERGNRLLFGTNADGQIASLSIQLEPSVAAARFDKQ